MFDIYSLGYSEEKCLFFLLVCFFLYYMLFVMLFYVVFFQYFLLKLGLVGWVNIKWKNVKVSVFQMNYIVWDLGRREGVVFIEFFGNMNFRLNYEIIYVVI